MVCTVVIIYDTVCFQVLRSDMFCSVIMIFLFHCKHVAASSSKFVSPLLGDSSLAGIHKYPIARDIYFKPIFSAKVLKLI